MNNLFLKQVLNNPLRRYATAADIFAGTIVYKKKGAIKQKKIPRPTYGGRHIVTMLPGVGAGPLLMEYVKDVFKTAYVPVDFEIIETSDIKMLTEADDDIAISSLRRNGVGIKGHIPSPGDISHNVTLRTQLDLFVYLVHCKGYSNIKCRYCDLDMFIFRQNTEGEYSLLEHESKPGVVESLKIITKDNTERFARWALEFTKAEGRKKVTVIHKANIMKISDGLFMKTILEVAKDYPDLKVETMIVDNACMQLVAKPAEFDVLMMPNLYGNIITNIACGLIGGPGLISGQNYGESIAVFEVATRSSLFEDEKMVNPVGMLNAAINMLYHLKKDNHAYLIQQAVRKTLVDDKIHTPDIGGKFTSDEMVESIKKNVKEGLKCSDFALL